MQTTIVILVVLLGTLALPVLAGAVYQAIETLRDRRRFPPPGRLVRFNKRRMHIHITGEGTPTVVFESGMGASCLSWTLVQSQVAQFSRAVSYDRAGHGWSDSAPEPRTARQIAQELNTLLNATGLSLHAAYRLGRLRRILHAGSAPVRRATRCHAGVQRDHRNLWSLVPAHDV